MAQKLLLASLLMAAGILSAQAQYPDKPVKIVVPVAAGGGVDVMARLLAQHLGERLHQQFVVENRPGAAGVIGSKAVIASPADGTTLLYTPSSLSLSVAINKTPPYDLAKDFSPIVNVAISPYALVVNPSVPAHSLKEFIAYAKANPGKLSYGSAGVGSASHLAAELLKSKAGIEMVHVPNKGMNPALIDLMGGQVQVLFASVPGLTVGEVRTRAADRDGGDEALGADAGPADDGRIRPAGFCRRQLGRTARARRPRRRDREEAARRGHRHPGHAGDEGADQDARASTSSPARRRSSPSNCRRTSSAGDRWRKAASEETEVAQYTRLSGGWLCISTRSTFCHAERNSECRGLARDAGDVRRQQQPRRGFAGELEQRIVGRGRFGRIDIDRRAAEMAGDQACRQRRLVDDAAARGLDQHRAGLHASQARAAPIRFCVAGSSGTCSDTTSEVESSSSSDIARASMPLASAGRRIEEADLRAHADERLRHRAADGAEADQADLQALDAGEIVRHHAGAELGVVAGLDLGVGPGEAPQQHRRGGHGIFRHRAVAAARRRWRPECRAASAPPDRGDRRPRR